MEPSVILFLASIVFGCGFAIGQTIINTIAGAIRR